MKWFKKRTWIWFLVLYFSSGILLSQAVGESIFSLRDEGGNNVQTSGIGAGATTKHSHPLAPGATHRADNFYNGNCPGSGGCHSQAEVSPEPVPSVFGYY